MKNNNCFIHKGLNGVILSKEPGNLYNVHCYKYSGEESKAEQKRTQQLNAVACIKFAVDSVCQPICSASYLPQQHYISHEWHLGMQASQMTRPFTLREMDRVSRSPS